jgi:hypothetical protein
MSPTIPIPYGTQILDLIPVFLMASGILTLLYGFVRWKTPGKTTGAEILLGVVTFIIGFMLPIGAALCYVTRAFGTFTVALLLILSGALFLGPISRVIKRIPTIGIAAVIALIASYVIATFVTAMIPPALQAYISNSHWLLIILFIIILALLFTLLVFAKGLIEIIGLVLGAWPVMMVIGVICIIQGVLLVFGMSLSQAFEVIMVPW